MGTEELDAQIAACGAKIRDLKAAKAAAEDVKKCVAELLALKAEYKTATGNDWKPPASAGGAAATPSPAPAKKEKEAKKGTDAPKEKKEKESKKADKGDKGDKAKAGTEYIAPKVMTFYPSPTNSDDNMKCLLLAGALEYKIVTECGIAPTVPRLPALSDWSASGAVVRFGSNAICRYLSENCKAPSVATGTFTAAELDAVLDLADAEGSSSSGCGGSSVQSWEAALKGKCASAGSGSGSALVDCVSYPVLKRKSGASGSAGASIVSAVDASTYGPAVVKQLSGGLESLEGLDYSSAGLLYSLKLLFSHAILRAFPRLAFGSGADADKLRSADVARCNNPAHGDFQCNSAMGIAKYFKGLGVASNAGTYIRVSVSATITCSRFSRLFLFSVFYLLLCRCCCCCFCSCRVA